WGIICKMYSNESTGGAFPPGSYHRPYATSGDFDWGIWGHMGAISSGALYPEYWTDAGIARCPSDVSGDAIGNSVLNVESDFSAQIQRIQSHISATPAEEVLK